MLYALDAATKQLLFPSRIVPEGRNARALGIWRDFSQAALDLIFPPHCCSCISALPPDTNKALCLSCAEDIQWIGQDRCSRCGDAVGLGSGVVSECHSCRTHPPVFVHSACTLAKYSDGPLRNLILALKFSRKIHVARVLGEILARRIESTCLLSSAVTASSSEATKPNIVIVPSPLTRKAASVRGFNQAEELAFWVSRRLGFPLETRLLKKIRSTPTQAKLSHEKRRVNLKGAFTCDPALAERYKDARVLLIDDVITTGSTISECARTLSAAGIGEIRAAAVARG